MKTGRIIGSVETVFLQKEVCERDNGEYRKNLLD